MTQDDLLPCPFCGGKARPCHSRIAEDGEEAWITCTSCGATTEQFEDAYAPFEQARSAWNSRLSNDAAEITRLRTALAASEARLAIAWNDALEKAAKSLDRRRETIQRVIEALTDEELTFAVQQYAVHHLLEAATAIRSLKTSTPQPAKELTND